MAARSVAVHSMAGISYLLLIGALLISIAYPIRKVRICPSPWTKRLVYGALVLAIIFLVISVVLTFALNND